MKYLFMVIILLMSNVAYSQTPSWQMIPNESSISFTATQNNSPVSGKFKSFTAVINADPQQLNSSHAEIKINMDSVSTDYKLVADTLKTENWFDVKQFPEAIFNATHFKLISKNTYQVDGILTLRDKKQSVILNLNVEDLSPTKIKIKGSTELKRTMFGIGQGDFAKTDDVKDDVRVDVVLTAIKKSEPRASASVW